LSGVECGQVFAKECERATVIIGDLGPKEFASAGRREKSDVGMHDALTQQSLFMR
jgi:hypothetical protein